MVAQSVPAKKAGRREWTGLWVLSIACLIYSMDLSVLFLALPAIVADLEPSPTEILWINDIYGFMVAGFLVAMGTLGDRYGRRRILLIGAASFGAASLMAAFAHTASMLVLARALLGIAGATIAPSTLSLVVNMFSDEAERNRAIGIWGTAFATGGMIGPIIGGVLLQFFPWGSVFLINVPVMLVLLVTAPFLLPEYRTDSGERIDIPSVLLSLATVLPIIYGFKRLAADGMALAPWLPILGGFVVGMVFLQRQRTLRYPLVDLALFKLPAFSTSLAVNLMGVFFVFGSMLFMNQYLQLVLGLSALKAGLWTALPSFVAMVMSMQSYRIINRYGPVRTVIFGLLLNALASIMMGVAALSGSLFGILAADTVLVLGFVPVILTTTSLIVGSAPVERAGSASALSETSAELGGALGVALLGSLGTLIYRSLMFRIDPATLPADHANIILGSLAGAVDVARRADLSSHATPWLETARTAFSDGFAVISFLAAAALLLLAFLAHRVLSIRPADVDSTNVVK